MSRGEKITWGFFALTSMQLAFLQPQIALVHGARTNLFSGILVGLYFHPDPGLPINCFALLLPILASLMYFQLFDALLFPQICWFFHIVLGLIPTGSRRRQAIVMPAQESLGCGAQTSS
jgi:hypothetical protein